ncbi:hypothetical protein ACVWYU_001397 [Pseudomonas sp. TE12234]
MYLEKPDGFAHQQKTALSALAERTVSVLAVRPMLNSN